jgi:recombination protein RecA
MGDSHVGLQARLMSQALRKLSGSLSRSGTTAVFINQLREKIGVMFGSPETTPGGRALKFYSSVRLDIRRIGALKVGNDAVGNQTRVKIVKNKVAPPFKTVEFDVMYGEGISKEGSLLDIAIEHEVIQKSGAWFAYGEERIGQGRENAKQFLKENDEVRERVLGEVYDKLGLDWPSSAPASGSEEAPPEPAAERPVERPVEPAEQIL